MGRSTHQLADDDERVVDLTRTRAVNKKHLPHDPHERICETEQHARDFGRAVGRFTSHPSHPDSVGKTIAPIWNYLRDKRDHPVHKPLIDGIEDLRVTFIPHCDPRMKRHRAR